MLAYLSQTSLQVFSDPSSIISTSKSFSVWEHRLSSNSSTSSGRLNTGTIIEYFNCQLSIRELLLHTVQITAVTSIDLNEVTLVDEQRNTNLYASLQCSGLGSIGSGVTLDAWL